MRAFFETPEWWPRDAGDTTTDTVFKMYGATMSTVADGSKNDLVYRIFEANPNATIYAFENFEDASAADTNNDAGDLLEANKVLAYSQNFTAVGATRTGLTLSNNAAYGPDMSNLRVEYSGALTGSDWTRYYHYTSNISEATMRVIHSILEEYIGTGKAFGSDFDVFGIEYGRTGKTSRGHQLLILYGGEELGEGSNGFFSITVGFRVQVFMRGVADGIENHVMKYANRVASILGDERRTLNDFCNVGVTIQSISEPAILDKENAGVNGQAVQIEGTARYKDLHSMDINR